MSMQQGESAGFFASSAPRVAFWGCTIVGFAGLILAVNAALDSEWVGAGLLLIASAVAFGAIGYVSSRR
ncbi:MAG: hypothetical protein IH868_04985 [Chloroflexi bacterium]|nr:hypothetical protein [Chloroflexota bacterium]MCH8222750.1 hypothetical protein [Chloroflexota bacterium]